ncbi:MAG: SpoVG family protein [Candidatus Brocadiia bacterium]
MNITEVRIKLMRNRSDRLRAFCSITIDDDFVVHDLRVIEGRKGFFVAMPSRKLTDNCPACGSKNELRARHCSNCGQKLDEERAADRDKFHVDVAHPINTPCREMLQETVLAAYQAEMERLDQGLEPQREYEGEGLEELAEDYTEPEVEEEEYEEPEEPIEAGPQPVEVEPEPTEPEPEVLESGPEPATFEPEPVEQPAEPQPVHEPPVEEEEFPFEPGPAPEVGEWAEEDLEEEEEEEPEEEEPEGGEFGAGIF